MRRADITPELIELSKRAKELGFPQDVEKGDWYGYVTYTDELFVLGAGEMICGVETEETKLYLILSFSRCLEWLRGKFRDMHLDSLVYGKSKWEFDVCDPLDKIKYENIGFEGRNANAKTHHEAIAKAVVKILEGEG